MTLSEFESFALAPGTSCDMSTRYQTLDSTRSPSHWQLLDTDISTLGFQDIPDGNSPHSREDPSINTHVSTGSIELEFPESNASAIEPSSSPTTLELGTTAQATGDHPNYPYYIPQSRTIPRCISKNTDAASGGNGVSQGSAGTNPNRCRSHTSPRETSPTAGPIRCWLHNCNGRAFTHLSNYRRHCREKSGRQAGFPCSLCGKHFTRKAAWKAHTDQQRCKFIDYDANGVPFEWKRHSSVALHATGNSQNFKYQLGTDD